MIFPPTTEPGGGGEPDELSLRFPANLMRLAPDPVHQPAPLIQFGQLGQLARQAFELFDFKELDELLVTQCHVNALRPDWEIAEALPDGFTPLSN